MKKNQKIFVLGLISILLAGCSNAEPESSPATSKEIFKPVDSEGVFNRTYKGSFPIENSPGYILASDSSGKGPFTAYIACTENDEMLVSIDKGAQEQTVLCDGNKHKIEGIQKIAITGGVKTEISSPKETGDWQFQLIGS